MTAKPLPQHRAAGRKDQILGMALLLPFPHNTVGTGVQGHTRTGPRTRTGTVLPRGASVPQT